MLQYIANKLTKISKRTIYKVAYKFVSSHKLVSSHKFYSQVQDTYIFTLICLLNCAHK